MPKRILFVDHAPFAGGAQLVLAEHIRLLDKQRFEAHVACTDMVPDLPAKFGDAGARVHVLDMPRMRGTSVALVWQLPKAIWQLRRLISRQHIDLVVANSTRTSYLVSVAQLGTKVPVIWWVRDFLYPRRIFGLLKWLPRRIIFVSKAVRNYYVPPAEPKAVVLYVASNLYRQLDDVTEVMTTRERAKYGFTADDLVVGFMGRLVDEKGAEDVVRAVASLSKDFPQLRLLVVGTGKGQMHDVENKLHDLVKEQQLADVVKFAGYQKDEAVYYSLFDIFVLATRDAEPFATSVVQAMMAGNTVIGTRAGGTPELVIDGQTGLLYPPADVSALATAIARLIKDKSLRLRLAQAGKQRVLHYHREDQLARQAEALYDEVLNTR